jgi:hypothetical protein
MKKFTALLLALMMVFSLTACKSNETTTEQTGDSTPAATQAPQDATDAVDTVATTYPEEKVLIGVEIYDPTDSEFLALQEYFNYLSENMNVEFKYSEAIADADGEMKFIEDCAMAGAKGFLAYYNVTVAEQPRAVIDYGMYYWGASEDEEIYSEFVNNPLYLGSVNTGNGDYAGGHAMGEWVLEQGYDTVIYANGGADFGVPLFVARQQGFMDAMEGSNVKIVTVSGFPGDQFFADQAAALGTEGLDAVCASFNGVDFWAQPIASAGLKDTVKLATIGSINQAYVDAFKDGSVALVASANIQRFGIAVGMICNAVDQNADALKVDGAATNAPEDIWIVNSAEDCQKLFDIQQNEKVFDADAIKSLAVKVNPSASAQTITDLLASAKLDNLLK